MGGGSTQRDGSMHLARPASTQPCSQGAGPSRETKGLPCAGPLVRPAEGVKLGRRVQGCTGEGVGAGRVGPRVGRQGVGGEG